MIGRKRSLYITTTTVHEIDSASGLISGTLAYSDAETQAGQYPITVPVTDASGDSASASFTWTVTDTDTPPTLDNPGNTPYAVTVTSSDGMHSANATFNWTVSNGQVTVTNPGTQNNGELDDVSLQISASDSTGNPLTYSAGGLPPGLQIDSASGLISGTIDGSAAENNNGVYQVTVLADDGQGNNGSATFTWNVNHTNQAPTLDNPGDQVNQTGDVVSLGLNGYDDDGDTLTYSADGLPPGLSLDTTTGTISGTLSASSASATPYSVTVSVSDGSLSASQSFNWYVTANAVTLTNPGDQTNTEGDAVTLQLSATDTDDLTLTYAASGLPSGLSINGTTGVISGTVASGDAAAGPYTVTVSAADTQGNSSAQQFTWTVNAPDHAVTLANPGDQSNAEGDTVSLQLQGSDPDGDTLTYAASGLPIGLLIDPTTGLISGTVDYSAAEVAGGQYQVTVAVNDGNGDTASQSFVWTIADTDQGPWLAYPGLQNNAIGDQVSLQLSAGSPDGKALTYLAGGLPAGLTVDPNTGLIGGTITAAVGPYTVTASVSDGIKTASQTFTWQVASEEVPEVLLSFDGQPVGEDYLTEVDPAVPVSVLVTLKNAGPGMHTIHIDIPSGESKLDQPTFQLADDGSKTIALTPEEESESFDDVLLVAFVDGKAAGDADGTNAKVTIAAVRNPDTPAGMKVDRIPPMDPKSKDATPNTEVAITITPTLKDAKVVVFQVAGNGGANGTANLLNSKDHPLPRVHAQESGAIFVVGMAQTAPSMTNGEPDGFGSNAGKLSIVAYGGTQTNGIIDSVNTTKEFAKSAGFSVAAIPIRIRASFDPDKLHGNDVSKKGAKDYLIAWAIQYNILIRSDSGSSTDLNEVLVSEEIQRDKNNPSTDKLLVSDYLPADKPQVDRNGRAIPVPKQILFQGKMTNITLAYARKNGLEVLQAVIDKKNKITDLFLQKFNFIYNRTGTVGADGKPLIYTVADSGYKIERTQEKRGKLYFVIVTRSGAAVAPAQAGLISPKDSKPKEVQLS